MEVAPTTWIFFVHFQQKNPQQGSLQLMLKIYWKLLVRSQNTTESAPKPPCAVNDREIQAEEKRAR